MHDKNFEKFNKLFDSIGKFTRTEKLKAMNEANVKKHEEMANELFSGEDRKGLFEERNKIFEESYERRRKMFEEVEEQYREHALLIASVFEGMDKINVIHIWFVGDDEPLTISKENDISKDNVVFNNLLQRFRLDDKGVRPAYGRDGNLILINFKKVSFIATEKEEEE